MQEKAVFDTNVYIGIFNRGLYHDEINAFSCVMYLAHPVLHELWMGAKGEDEVRHLIRFGNTFIKLKRFIQPQPSTQILIGQVCRKLRLFGLSDPTHPRIYNDVCIAVLARQIGATLITRNIADFDHIRKFVDFKFREVKTI